MKKLFIWGVIFLFSNCSENKSALENKNDITSADMASTTDTIKIKKDSTTPADISGSTGANANVSAAQDSSSNDTKYSEQKDTAVPDVSGSTGANANVGITKGSTKKPVKK